MVKYSIFTRILLMLIVQSKILFKENSPFLPNLNEAFEVSPTIFDPLTYNNASKSSFKIEEVKKIFSDTFDKLILLKLHLEKEDSKSLSLKNCNFVYEILLNYDKINTSD
jgi:hypothetical protein